MIGQVRVYTEEIDALRTQVRFLGWLMAAMLPTIAGLAAASQFLGGMSETGSRICLIIAATAIALAISVALLRHRARQRVRCYAHVVDQIDALLASMSSAWIRDLLKHLDAAADEDSAISALVEQMRPAITRHLGDVLDSETKADRRARVAELCAVGRDTALSRVEAQREASAAIRAQRTIADALETIKRHKADAERQLDERREKSRLKWWLDITRPVFTEVDAKITKLERAQKRLVASGDIEKTNAYFDSRAACVARRTAEIQAEALSAIPPSRSDAFDEEKIVCGALLLGAMSVPVSAWNDFMRAGDIYDSLREVNGTYAGMGDFDIWLDTLALPGEQLAGLASLTKGAYFEKLVEADFGGERFEHFNHPDTDILIDGVAYQIKATGSTSYVESVGEGIPVISTSEVARLTDSIDGGYANLELTESIDLALGGTVLDIGDAALDGLLTVVGGVGLLSAVKGIGSASKKYRESGNAVESLAEGLDVTIVNSARSVVNLGELATKGTVGVVTSRPMRFVGRLLKRAGSGAVNRFDRWLEDGDDPTSAASRRR